MNAEWDAWLADLTKPSRATVEARLVDDEITVEIQATAALRPAIRPIQTARAAPAVGPYNQAVVAGGNVYVSGCIGLDEKGMMVGDSVSAQTERALANMREILNESGVDVASVVKTTVLLHDMDDFAAVNEVYASFFEGGIVPARACFAAKQLPKGALVEIDAVAIVN